MKYPSSRDLHQWPFEPSKGFYRRMDGLPKGPSGQFLGNFWSPWFQESIRNKIHAERQYHDHHLVMTLQACQLCLAGSNDLNRQLYPRTRHH